MTVSFIFTYLLENSFFYLNTANTSVQLVPVFGNSSFVVDVQLLHLHQSLLAIYEIYGQNTNSRTANDAH